MKLITYSKASMITEIIERNTQTNFAFLYNPCTLDNDKYNRFVMVSILLRFKKSTINNILKLMESIGLNLAYLHYNMVQLNLKNLQTSIGCYKITLTWFSNRSC